MKVWVLSRHSFNDSDVWDVYEDVEKGKRDVNLPHDIKEWRYMPNSDKWITTSDLTWDSYQLEGFEVK